jgi:hypothetical protein
VQKPRQSAIGKDRGRVRQRQGEAFAEVAMQLLVHFRKIKNCWKLSEKRAKREENKKKHKSSAKTFTVHAGQYLFKPPKK